jgi:hypothetical protein
MKTKIIYLPLLFIISSIVISGCASAGHDFKYDGPASLHLGQTRGSDFQALFGKPASVTTKKSSDGEFEVNSYVYAHADMGTAKARALTLESRNGVLNAYQFVSSFDKDKTSVTPDQLKQIQRGVSTKDDVLKVVGEPHGKALCPSSLGEFKDRCSKGTEVWVWTMMMPMVTFGSHQPQIASIFVTFDEKGIATELESVEQNKKQ